MYRKPNLTPANFGDVFGRLTFIRAYLVRKYDQNIVMGEFTCSCNGERHDAVFSQVKHGRIKSCGCMRLKAGAKSLTLYNKSKITHGESKTELHIKWSSMKWRCDSPSNSGYANYGARGIRVCDEWRNSFESFKVWAIANGWKDQSGLSIERKDVNGNYEPENCELIPITRQSANQRSNRKLTLFGETKNVADWARDQRCVVKPETLYKRLCYGFSDEEAVTLPIQRNRKYKAFGESKSLREWSHDSRCSVELELLKERVYRGWDVEKAILLPLGPTSPKNRQQGWQS